MFLRHFAQLSSYPVNNLNKRYNRVFYNNYIPIVISICCKSDIMKFLNVAEKNDAAKNIAAHLSRGGSRRREGFSQYNKIYEFEADVNGQKCQMVMTSVSGHLLELKFVDAYKSWQSCNPLTLFDAPVYKHCPENYQNIKKTLEREVRGCQGLIIWTDCDREGENIGFEIIEVCRAVKSGINIYRAKFSEITSVSVWRALQNLEQPDKNISDAVDVRQELDLRIGAAFTRFQTLRLQKVFPSKLHDSLVSYGSCQFPTLGFVVERYRAVESFVAEPFWKIKVIHTMNNLSVDFSWDRVRLFDQQACQVLHDTCLDAPQATVTDVKTKPKSKWRPLPLDTVELEKLASRKLKINAKETMRIAEKLYTQGFISYPRTETNEFPKEMNLAELVRYQTGDPHWGPFAQGILDSGGPTPRQGNKSDKAHPPIHPTKYADGKGNLKYCLSVYEESYECEGSKRFVNALSGNEKKLYEFIVRSFLACCSKDAQGQETIVSITISEEKFQASGLLIIARNYLDVYPYDKWSSKEIHVYQNGQTFNPTSIDMVDGSTAPPNLLTEADLIALMEKHGIGTDATHADHIETIKSRSYVALADAIHFVPGLLGMGLVEGYDAMGLTMSKPHLRAQLEADLKAISEGRRQPQIVLAEQVAKYREVYIKATAEANKIDAALSERFSEQPVDYTPTTENLPTDMRPVLKCPKCNTDMVLRKKKNSEEYYIGCLSFPTCKNAVWFPSIVRSVDVLQDTCNLCGPNYKKIKLHYRNNTLSHLYPSPYTACIGGCDLTFLEYMQINPSSVQRTSDSQSSNSSGNIATSTNTARSTNANTARSTNANTARNTNTNTARSTNANTARSTNANTARSTNTNTSNSNVNTITNMNIGGNTSTFTTARSMVNQPAQSTNMNPNQTNRASPSQLPQPGDDNELLCYCNLQAIQLTVRKQNNNHGKQFYKCSRSKDNGGCDFFAWAPGSSNDTANQNGASTSTANQGGGWGNSQGGNTGWGLQSRLPQSNSQGNDDDVVCGCGMPAKKLTVHKDGPNKGREFYSCTKDMHSRCSFFQWADASPSSVTWNSGGNSSSRSSYRGGRGRGRGGGTRGARKCSICKQEGHTKQRCPNADQS